MRWPLGEQILGPTDVLLSNWTVRPSSGCSVVLATHTAGVSVDGYTLTLAVNPWNIARTYNLTPGRELLFACRSRLGTASNFVVYMSEADNVYDPLYGSFEHGQDVLHSASERGGEAAREVLLEPTLTTLGNFLARSNSQNSVSFTWKA